MAPYFSKLTALAAVVAFAFAAPETYYNPKIKNPNMSDDTHFSDKWIVVFYEGNVTSAMAQSHYDETGSKYMGRCTMTGSFAMDGFHGYTLATDLPTINEIATSNMVQYIERTAMTQRTATVTQNNSPYNLARISRTTPAVTNQYFYDDSAGAGSTVYVIDSGVNVKHAEFEGRATNFDKKYVMNETLDDLDGHGTNVAGIVASKTWGVAKKASIIAVKVLNQYGNGEGGATLLALNDIMTDIKAKGLRNVVINYSVGGGYNEAEETAWNRIVVNQSVTVVCSAGNGNKVNGVNVGYEISTPDKTNNAWPAQIEKLISVGNIDKNNTRAPSSNFGKLVDIWAPGTEITSVGNGDDSTISIDTGTSQASPHIAGLAAYLFSLDPTLNGPDAVLNRILTLATKGQVSGGGPNSPNLIGFNGAGAGAVTSTITSSRTSTTTSIRTSTSTATATFTTEPYKPTPSPYKPKNKKPMRGSARL